MKNLILVILTGLFMVSCGKSSNKDNEAAAEKVTNKYVVSIEAIYQKNDSCVVVIYDENNNEVLDKRSKIAIKGMEVSQKINVDLPEGVQPFNIGLGLSTNKEQTNITLTKIAVLKNDKIIAGNPSEGYLPYFSNNDCIVIDPNTLKHTLKHDKPYSPGLVGSERVKAALSN